MTAVASSGLTAFRPPRQRPRKKDWVGWSFIAPFAVVFILVLIVPVVYAIYLSFFQQRIVGGNTFVGLDNYAGAFTDPLFWSGFGRVLLFFVIQVPIMLTLSALTALAIDSARLHFPSVFRISLFLPYAVPGVVAALMWGFIYGSRFGLVGNFNDYFGVSLPDPLSNQWILAGIGNIATWAFVGYNMLIMYSSLRVVPGELYEAADIDGASAWHVIRAIKFPAMRPSLMVALVFSIIGSFQLFTEPNVLATLVPNSVNTAFSPNMYAYNLSFAGQQFNYAAAIAIIMGIFTMIVAYIAQVVGNRKD